MYAQPYFDLVLFNISPQCVDTTAGPVWYVFSTFGAENCVMCVMNWHFASMTVVFLLHFCLCLYCLSLFIFLFPFSCLFSKPRMHYVLGNRPHDG